MTNIHAYDKLRLKTDLFINRLLKDMEQGYGVLSVVDKDPEDQGFLNYVAVTKTGNAIEVFKSMGTKRDSVDWFSACLTNHLQNSLTPEEIDVEKLEFHFAHYEFTANMWSDDFQLGKATIIKRWDILHGEFI